LGKTINHDKKNKEINTDKKPALRQQVTKGFFQSVKIILEQARQSAYRAVNFAMVTAYWEVGRLIVEEEQQGKDRAEYGRALITELSKQLTKDFGKGFTARNLRNMRAFYLAFPIWHAVRAKSESGEKGHAVRTELSWTHYRLLLKAKNKKARLWYMNKAADCGWSTRQLERQINSFYYERLLASRDKVPVRQEAKEKLGKIAPENFIKDPYVLEFLNIKEQAAYRESELERAILDKLQAFLLELGRGFAFAGRQYRVTVDGDHFYCDLVFYNFILKCFLIIDLKIGKLTHEDIGQMDFYVRYFEKEVRRPDDQPTIGLILCSDKNDAMVKYTLLEENKQLFASKYQLYLPTEEELRKELGRERHLLEQSMK
jgi:predicted nuclease of restriction endonuclease-like (RecB) superfamily